MSKKPTAVLTEGKSVRQGLESLGVEIPGPQGFRKHKFGAVRTEVDGIKFDSKAEAKRYGELKLLADGGTITGLEIHPQFPLHVLGQYIGYYEADFAYVEFTGRPVTVVEDVKGVRTPMYRWKKRHFEIEYQTQIREIGPRRRRRSKAERVARSKANRSASSAAAGGDQSTRATKPRKMTRRRKRQA